MNSQSSRNIINDSIINIIKLYLDNKIDFSLVVATKGWEKELPSDLAKNKYIIITIDKQTLDDSYFDADLDLPVIYTNLGNIDNSIILYPQLVKAIMTIDMTTPIINKPFDDYTEIFMAAKKVNNAITGSVYRKFLPEEITDSISRSIEAFIKNNENLKG